MANADIDLQYKAEADTDINTQYQTATTTDSQYQTAAYADTDWQYDTVANTDIDTQIQSVGGGRGTYCKVYCGCWSIWLEAAERQRCKLKLIR